MRSISRLLVVTWIGVLTSGCGDSQSPVVELPRELSVAEGKLVDADNHFAFRLLREVSFQDAGKNIFISPLSVGMALGMTYNGAAGDTRDSMQIALGLQNMSIEEVNRAYRSLIDLLRNLDPRVEFLLANSIWYRNTLTFEQVFLDLNSQYFDAKVSALDFNSPGAASTINDWVNQNTSGRIEEIVDDPIDPATIMFVINAIYFKADWASQFNKDLTRKAPFFLEDGSQTTSEMMVHEDEVPIRSYHDRDNDVLILDLPYGGRAYSMTILMPEQPQRIDSMVDDLTHDRWMRWIAALDSTSGQVSMPKFTLEYELEMNDVLDALGMGIAFDENRADFTNLYAPGGAYISKVKHKTFVDVNEEGTEAAAATSVDVALTSAPMPLEINGPFVFAIRENQSGTILFVGKMMNPSQPS